MNKKECDINDAYSNFLIACDQGDLSKIKTLIADNQDLNIHADDEWGLRKAVYAGHLDIVEYLDKDHQADIFIGNDITLYWAAYGHRLNVVKYLIERGLHKIEFKDMSGCERAYKFCKENVDTLLKEKLSGRNLEKIKNISPTAKVRRRPKTMNKEGP